MTAGGAVEGDDDPEDEPARIEARFDRGARLDRWVQARASDLWAAYDEHGDGRTMLALAASTWVRELPRARSTSAHAIGRPSDAPRALDVDQAVAAIATAVAASVTTNLEPACARLVWAARGTARTAEALEAAEHYAVLGLATARRRSEREAAECVWEGVRFVAAAPPERGPADDALARFAELAARRLVNLGALVGAHLPFWSFPYAFRWERDAPPFGRAACGLPDPVDDRRIEGWLSLAYRVGKTRAQIASAIEACAWHTRRLGADDALGHAQATREIAELAEELSKRWSVRGARSAADAIERVVPRTLLLPFALREPRPGRAEERAQRVLGPVLATQWPDVAELAREHDAWRRAQSAACSVAA